MVFEAVKKTVITFFKNVFLKKNLKATGRFKVPTKLFFLPGE